MATSTDVATVSPATRAQRPSFRGKPWFWVFVGPLVVGLVVFNYVPIGWSILLSFADANNTVTPTAWVGLQNYIDLLNDPAFRDSLLTFVVFAVFIVPTTYVISLGLAVLVNQVRFMRAFFRSAFFLPAACSYVVAATIWKQTIFNGLPSGVANVVVGWVGIDSQAWLSPPPDLYWIVIVSLRLWLQVGFYMILLLAALQKISPDLYEAAYVDGAKPGWQTFRFITVPQLKAASISVLVLLLVNAFQAFDEFWNLLQSARGYPPYARPPLVYLFNTSLGTGQDFGHGGAGAVILTLLIVTFTLVQGRLLGFGKDRGEG